MHNLGMFGKPIDSPKNEIILRKTGNIISREIGIVEIDSAVMDPKELLICWENCPSPTFPVYNIQYRDYYLLYLPICTSIYMEVTTWTTSYISQDQLFPTFNLLMTNLLIGIDTNLEIILIGTRFFLKWDPCKVIWSQVDFGKPSSARSWR